MLPLTALTAACTVYEPVPVPAYDPNAFDRVWNSALGAAEDAGITITSADRTSGVIKGSAGSTAVSIRVGKQADGKIRVEFTSKGPEGQNPDLNERFSGFYHRRMGRT